MTERGEIITAFLARKGWADARRRPVAGDASFRRYERLEKAGQTAILMDAPPAFEDVVPFMAIARHLRDLSLSAPEILAADQAAGLLLLEDLGDDLFARVIATHPGRERALYRQAVDLLLHLQNQPPPGTLFVADKAFWTVPPYDAAALLREVALFVDWYLPALRGKRLSSDERRTFLDLWAVALAPVKDSRDCLVLRDYHAENLIALDDREGVAATGLLDFQDALVGHRAYDLVSLLQDARRDVPAELEERLLDYYLEKSGLSRGDFLRDYALLGAQRNTKIIGIFARLAHRDSKHKYLSLIPRVWGHLERDLRHPALAEIRQWMTSAVPAECRETPPRLKPSMPDRAMVLAAGLGTRMRPLTDHVPKPLIPVAGRDMLSRILDGLAAAGVSQAVINVHYRADQIEQALAQRPDPRPKIILSDERDRLLDSGGGVKKALPHLGGAAFYVLNSDLIWTEADTTAPELMLHRLAAGWDADKMDILMLLMPTMKAVGYDGPGDFHLAGDGRLTPRKRGNEEDAGADYMYAGVMIMSPTLFQQTPEGPFSLRDIFQAAARRGRLYGQVHEGGWYHVGTPAALARIEQLLTTGGGDSLMARQLGKAPELYTIPARYSFVDTLAQGVMTRFGQDPLSLSDVLILLPNRRGVRSLREAFLRLSGGKSILLPRLQPIGDVEEDEMLLGAAALPQGIDTPDLPPPISPYQRQMLLMEVITRWYKRRGEDPPEVAQSAILAGALGRFLDQVQTERLSFDDLKELVPEDYAVHWQETLEFLKILTQNWPGVLAATGHMDAAARRNRLLEGLRQQWLQNPPTHPVIAAGSTGSIPATADLLEVIARLPRGMVVLPGMDVNMDEESWQALEPTHPQYTMKQLLQKIGAERIEVQDWLSHFCAGVSAALSQSPPARERLLTEIMRPAATTDRWREMDVDLETATKGLIRLDLPGPREEAGVIALMLRRALEEEGRTAALITPDRQLARRVAGGLRRWGIVIDDSAGTPLFNTPPGVYLRLTARMVAEQFAPVPLLSALKHPLMCAGQDPGIFRKRVRQLEKNLLRGPRPGGGLKGIRAALMAAIEEKGPETGPLQALEEWWSGVAAHLAPMETLLNRKAASFGALLKAHITMAEALAATDEEVGEARLWKGDAGEQAARLVEELQLAADSLPSLPPEQYPALLEVFMREVTVRPRYGQHPRLNIWGPLEARLQHADLVILAGLNEGSWPPEATIDPWMSRPMREKFGLPSLEQKIGLSAHDFIQAASAPNVVLTRAEKQDGTPTVKSRWLARMEAIVPPGYLHPKTACWADWYRLLDQPAQPVEIHPPRPTPPVEDRPRQLSVTAIQTWMRDPYSLYARYILNLKPLDPLDADPGAADKGIIIHAALDWFMREYADHLPEDAHDRLIEMGREEFTHVLDRPTVWAFWWPRFVQIAEWFVDNERRRRAEGLTTVATEISGRLELDAPGGVFCLTAQADRIDRRADGSYSIIDYKTGQSATPRQLHAGYAPQLPLEGVILQAGGFKGLSGVVGELSYWQLKGGDEPARITSFHEAGIRQAKINVSELIDKSRAGLVQLIASFDQRETPYLSTPRPDVLGYGEYDHLARVKEWQGRLKDISPKDTNHNTNTKDRGERT